jgi:flagellar biogenesis protein FliO
MRTAMAQSSAAGGRGGFSFRGLLSAFIYAFNRHGSGEHGALRMEERLSLGPKKTLFLVDCAGRKFLVAAGADTIVAMTEVRPQEKRRKVGDA